MQFKAFLSLRSFRFFVYLSCLFLCVFIGYYFAEVRAGLPLLYALLTISLLYKTLKILFEWYHYAGIKPECIKKEIPELQVDIMTTACPEEPREMIEQTLRAMVAVRYPHQNWLCEEGNDPYFQQLCQELGVHHLTRASRENAKAGNINNALKYAQGDICVILDPDHIPEPDFLDKVLPYFDDQQIGYVQVVQAYHNQFESLIAKAAAEQTYIFYGPFMQAMGNYGTAQAIGANCTFRRKALDSIGGHAAGLTEDMHTAMRLHARGWKSVYVPAIVSRGKVPSALSAYYKQQLKWARGTLELWLRVLPTLLSRLNWRQRLHYFALPLYYLSGFITLIDIIIPVIALLSGHYPITGHFITFAYLYTPCLIALVGLRLWGQQWTYEKQERGLHLLGGILRMGSWWIYILAFFYTLFNVKVPYIPTPKEYQAKNELVLGLPNMFMALLSLFAIVYGLKQDWQPFSWIMASFAGINAVFLSLAVIIGQNALFHALRSRLNVWKSLHRAFKNFSYSGFSRLSLKSLVFIPLLIIPFFFLFHMAQKNTRDNTDLLPLEKEYGGFYSGIYMPEADSANNTLTIDEAEINSRHRFNIIATYLPWSADRLPVQYWETIIARGSIPMISWEPWTNLFPEYANHPELGKNRKVFHYILEGYFDAYIDQMAITLRDLGYPVFLRFAHEMDNPMYPWSEQGGNSAEEFKQAWRYVYQRFEQHGCQNVSWVWNPWKAEAINHYFPNEQYYPDNRYVDWIGLTSLNYGQANPDQKCYSFEELYLPFRLQLEKMSISLPVMLAEFGSVSYGCDPTDWVNSAFESIQTHYPEIKSWVLFYSDQDKNWVTDWRPDNGTSSFIDWTYDLSSVSALMQKFKTTYLTTFPEPPSLTDYPRMTTIQKEKNKFLWTNNGEDIYFKGICYNPEHDWKDGFLPLTRHQLEHDFEQIRSMGANTIRRYAPSVYDINILNVAEEKGLNVLYGFWFDPTVDYFTDSATLLNYEKKVIHYVKKFKERQNIIAWNLGNETWGLQKKYFAKPYLTLTRKAYLNFLEKLAREIHEVDPSRPVFVTEELEHYQLPSTIYEMKVNLPSVNVIGINAYYEDNLKILEETFQKFDTLRPYVVTEFGPKGYWSEEFGAYRNDSLLIETSSLLKAQWYQQQWKQYIEKNRGNNLGGFAYCWRDRYEGTNTWFGITDMKGRRKPAYYALKEAWTDEVFSIEFPEIYIVGSWYPLEAGESSASSAGQASWQGAAVVNQYEGSLTYEWEVYDEMTLKKMDLIRRSLMENKFVQLDIPQKSGSYRVYVYATDSLGNVITASRPLLIQ